MRQQEPSTRGPIGWLKSRTIWGTLVEALCGSLFSIGFFGEGDAAVTAKKKWEDWLKGHRKQTYGVVMDYYEGSVKRGEPMLRDKKFWAVLLGVAVAFLPQLLDFVPQDTLGYVLITAVLPVVVYLHNQFKLDTEVEKTEQARQLVKARQIESRNLEIARELASSGQSPSLNIGTGGLDQVVT
ncbi:MAG: hypothetical protein ACXABY_01620 [Candidatus Thorarchaeota archaeon]|jgi:hypothetical protein